MDVREMLEFKKIREEILNLPERQKLHKVLVFGSYAHGKAHPDSDVDLLVILDKQGVSHNYKEMLINKKSISIKLRKLRKMIPVDLLVYTVDEWTMLRNSDSSFVRQIENEGIRLI